MKPKIALAMIVKGTDDEAPLLDKCLASIHEHIDAIFIDVNAPKGKKHSKEVLDIAKKYGADTKKTVWTGDFVGSRNANFARVPKDYGFILWLDADDTVDNPDKIREVCAIMNKNVDGLYIRYNYAQDEYGNTTVYHYPCRVIRNSGTFTWQSSFDDSEVTVHETLNQTRNVGKVMNDEFSVEHHSDPERMDASLARNIKLLEGMMERQKANPDPRILFYLATHYMDARMFPRAESLFTKYLTMSGWAEERSQAWVYLGNIMLLKQSNDAARGCYMKAVAENPSDPSPYVELAQLEVYDRMWRKAIEWLDTATRKKEKLSDTVIVTKPMEATYRAYKLLAEAYTNMGSETLEKASKWLTKAMEMRPYDPELHGAREVLDELIKTRDMNKAGLSLVGELRNSGELEKIVPFIDNLPSSMQDSPLVHSVRNYYVKPETWAKKSIAIVCGSSALGNWGPWSLETGIGGSEEAVIQLSAQLNEMGWSVTVYGIPGDKAGVHDNVTWKHYWEFNSKDMFDVLIGWRDPALFDKAFRARKRYLWLHDVIDKEELTEERLRNLEGVIFVSQYHRELFPMVPDEKAFASGNGIDPEQFSKLDGKVERKPKKVIYMSAHERGQELLQKIWNDVVEEVPEAELHCYYGWGGYDFVNKDNPERMAWKYRLIEDQKRLKNFTDHGKIGHDKIAEEIQSSGVWAYPCPFPEVYCITGVKAQAGGAYPVISDYAALKETVKYGSKLPMEELDARNHVGYWGEKELEAYKQELISVLKSPEKVNKKRTEMMKWARENMSWKKTAQAWSEEFEK